jgi:hypothetical protein
MFLAITDGVWLLTKVDVGVPAFAALIFRTLAEIVIQLAKVTDTLFFTRQGNMELHVSLIPYTDVVTMRV